MTCPQQVYAAAGRASPQHIRWLDVPLQLVGSFDPDTTGERVKVSIWDDVKDDLTDSLKADSWVLNSP